MVAAFKKNNTLEQTSFKLTDSGFLYRGVAFAFDDVVDVSRFRQQLETKTLFVGSDYTHGISVLFEMDSGEKVQLTEQPTWFSNSKDENINKIENIFGIVCEKSFQNRIMRYVEQVEKRGFYEYSGWHFYPQKREIIDYSNNRKYHVDDIKMLRRYGFIEIKNKQESIGEKFSQKIKGTVGINTLKNTDVFFTLLKHFFRLEWKN
jgi:hypothetical protein